MGVYYYNKKNGFTLVELLGVIVIIGILSAMAITGVTRLIDKTKNVSDDTLKDTARMAAESYMQANKDEMPKSIGETTDLKIETLINSNYIKEFKNSKKQDCKDNSYVKVYKQSKNKYVYTPYIYCGDSQTIKNSGPHIDILKVQEDNTTEFVIDIKDKEHNLNGYSFTLSTITKDSSNNNVTTEVYNSGSIQINNTKEFKKTYDISNYIDVTTANAIKIDVLAYNDVGERATDSINVSYTDKTPPTCTIESIYPPIKDNQWIGKDDYKKGIKRKVVAKCSDAESGCKRETFTSTWPKKGAKGLTTATISVYDNAGNEGICYIKNINVDIVSPSATLKAKSGNTIVTKKDHVVNDKTPSDTIKVDDYKNLSSNWMNKTNYPNGVTYEVTATDDFLDSWTWEVNAPGQSNVDEKAISSTNADGKTGNFTNSKTINVGFTGEGKRYGVLTIKDKAGNKATYKIYANIDKTDPTCLSSYSEPSNYNGSWTNKNITLVGKCSDSGSGCESNAKKTITTDTNGNISPGTVSDKAGNTVTCASKAIKVDKTAPNCTSSGGNSNWVNYNITLTGKCSDSGSGCRGDTSKTFSNDINTTTASPGSVYDNVGNKKDCPSNQTVRIDKTLPLAPHGLSIRQENGSSWSQSGFRQFGGGRTNDSISFHVQIYRNRFGKKTFYYEIDTIYADNPGGSGIKSNQYTWKFRGINVNYSNQCTDWVNYNCTYNGTGGTPTWIQSCARSIDQAGNVGPSSCAAINISW